MRIKISQSRTRQRIDELNQAAWKVSEQQDTEAGRAHFAHALGRLPGVTVLDPRIRDADRLFRCGHYAFGVRHGQAWAKPQHRLPTDLFSDPQAYLTDKRYHEVDKAQKGDVIIYTFLGRSAAVHFGIVHDARSLTIDSKFGDGPIVRHPHDVIYHTYGDQATIFRR